MKSLRQLGFLLAAPVLALAFSLALTQAVLALIGSSAVDAFGQMFEYAATPYMQSLIVNSAITYYIAAIAVAVGFKMNLFNIGVDGQYRVAALFAAYVGGMFTLPPLIHSTVIIVVAMVVGAAWAGIAALLKIYRGVGEVISTIMLNYIGGALVAWLLTPGLFAVSVEGSNNVTTEVIAESGHVPGIAVFAGSSLKVFGLGLLAVALGVGYWFLINRTRFGFDLRATGANEEAAVASGVDVKRMVLWTMLLSGAAAGLIGMPQLLGSSYYYGLNFPTGLGFTGVAIALLGRNHPVGIAFGALLWSFLDNASEVLNLYGIPKEVVKITQGLIVLSVVVAYEIVRRYRVRAEQRAVGAQTKQAAPAKAEGAAA